MLERILIKEIIGPIIIVLATFLIYLIIKTIIRRTMKLKLAKIDYRRHKTISGLILNVIKYILIIIAILSILTVYGINTSALLASLGAIGVVIGLAFQDILKDLLSGISIIIENQYGIGDTVTINDFKGEVLEIGLRTTRLKAKTGEIKIVSNRNINEVINHSFTTSLAIVDVMVSYEEDLKKVEEVLQNVCDKVAKEVKLIKGKPQVLGINQLGESGIEYRITAETKSMQHIDVQRILLREIKLSFDQNNIEIPYNQLVIRSA